MQLFLFRSQISCSVGYHKQRRAQNNELSRIEGSHKPLKLRATVMSSDDLGSSKRHASLENKRYSFSREGYWRGYNSIRGNKNSHAKSGGAVFPSLGSAHSIIFGVYLLC